MNLKGPFAALRAALPLLRNGASVIFNTTAATERGLATASVYSASKAALAAVAMVAAVELAPRGVRVNCVRPGFITTPIGEKSGLPPEAREGLRKWATSRIPMGGSAPPTKWRAPFSSWPATTPRSSPGSS